MIFLFNRVTEKFNSFFSFQIRRGHGETARGWAAKVIGTLDSIRDSRPDPYRILLQHDQSDFSYSELKIQLFLSFTCSYKCPSVTIEYQRG